MTSQQEFSIPSSTLQASPTHESSIPSTTPALPGIVPSHILEQFIPGFGIVNGLCKHALGFDLTVPVIWLFLFVGLTRAFSYISNYVKDFLVAAFTSSVSIPETSDLHNDVLDWMSTNVIDRKTWFSDGARSLFAATPKAWDKGHAEVHDTNRSIRYDIASGGPTWFFHYWCPIFFQRQTASAGERSPDISSDDPDPTRVVGTISLTCIRFTTSPLKRFLAECKQNAIDSVSTVTEFRTVETRYNAWQKPIVRPSRPLRTVDLDRLKKEALVSDIRKFLSPAARRFYAHRGIPYRRGYLFHGPPGTGKTSMSLALAGYFHLPLYLMDLAGYNRGDGGLRALWLELPAKCIILLEDFDSAGIGRGNGKPQESSGVGNSITLSGFLNAIDGVTSPEGRILIVTTNTPEALDEAMIRPGRIDMQVFFGPLTKASTEEIFMRMYTRDVDESETVTENPTGSASAPAAKPDSPPPPSPLFSFLWSSISESASEEEELRAMARTFAGKIPEEKFTPAEVQGFLLMNVDDPAEALANVDAWVERMLITKEERRNVIEEESRKKITSAADSADGSVLSETSDSTLINSVVRLADLPDTDDTFETASKSTVGNQLPDDNNMVTSTTTTLWPSDAKGNRRMSEYFSYRPKGAAVSEEEKQQQKRTSEYFKNATCHRQCLL